MLFHSNLLLLYKRKKVVLIGLREFAGFDLIQEFVSLLYFLPELFETFFLLEEEGLHQGFIGFDLVLELGGASVFGLLCAGDSILQSLLLLVLLDHELENLEADVVDLLIILKGLFHEVHLLLVVAGDLGFQVGDDGRLVVA